MSAALDRALERGLAARGRRAPAEVQASGGAGAAAVMVAAAGEGSGLGWASRGQPSYNHAEQYRRNQGWVFAAIRAIAQRWAGQPIRVARSKSRKGGPVPRALRPRREFLPRFLKSTQEQLELIDDHPILDAIDRPNSLMVRWSLGFITAASLELTGKSYWWVYEGVRKTDPPWTIMPLPSSWVEPKHRGTQLNASFLVRPGNAFEALEVPGEEIAYLHYPDPGNPLGALSPLQAMARSVSAHESISEAQRRSFVNGIWGGYAVTVGKNAGVNGQEGQRPVLTKDQRNQIVNAILQAYRGVLNYDQPVILDGSIDSISKISNTPREMDFLKSKAVCKEEITQGFGVNPIILGQVEGANRSSSATADDHFCSSTLNPKLELVSQILTAVVAPRFAAPGERLVLYYEPAHAYDPDLEMARWKFLLDNACADVNEVRQAMGLAPRPGGNVALLPVALAPYDLDTPHDFAADAAPPAGSGDGRPGGPPGGGGGADAIDAGDKGTDKAFHVDRRMGCYVSGG